LLDVGDEVLLSDPGYPCNRNIAQLLGIRTRALPVTAADQYQLSAAQLEHEWQAGTRAAMVSSPSNPTGTRIEPQAMQDLLAAVVKNHGHLIVDEIYQGLVYDVADYTALQYSDDVFVVNSFSKYFGMTGWRLGWMVVPEAFVKVIDRMAQNLFLAAPTMSQYAALAAFTSASETILQQRRQEFQQRRDYLLPALQALGFRIASSPQGAFYIYADCSAITDDAFSWSYNLLEQVGVAVTPGIDFGDYKAGQHLRFAYTRPVAELQRAVQLIQIYLNNT
jgi:aspartate/methionine/tyrosine aminotransferase